MGHPRLPILAIFALTYAGVAIGRVPGLKLSRAGIAVLGVIAMMIFAGVRTGEAVGYINWPTVFLLFGFFVISAQLKLSGFFDQVAHAISARLGHPARFLLVLMASSAGLSALLNHDVVCVAFTPIVASAVMRKGLNPVPFLVALAIASNIGSAATLVGNPQDMMIAQVAGLGFGPYVRWCLPPVLLAFAGAYGTVWLLSARGLSAPAGAVPGPAPAERKFNRAHTRKGLVILALVIALFFTPLPKEVVVLAAAGIHLASRKFRTEQLLGEVDWTLLVFFMALFVVTGAFEATGAGEEAVRGMARAGVDLASLPVLALVTTALSNLLNNAAAVMLLLKVVDVSHPATAYVLALANSFGGSLLITGSVASLLVAQQARSLGVAVSFRAFARLGIPATLVALAGLLAWAAVAG